MTPSPGTPTGTRPPRPPVDPRIRQRRVTVARDQGRRRLRVLLVALAVVVVALAVLGVLHTRVLAARVVTVVGDHPHETTAAIVGAAGLAGHPPMIDVDPGAASAGVEALPWIATATVTRHWPDGVRITVSERSATLAMAGPGKDWTVLDPTGRALQVVPVHPPGLAVLVVHGPSGPVPPPAVGSSLGPVADPGLEVARTLPPAFAAQVLAVTVAADQTVSLYLNSGLTVLLGTATDLEQKYEDVATIIARAPLRGAHTIDVSVPQSPTVSAATANT